MNENIEQIKQDLNISFDDDAWFDFWHTHVDWDGEGNASPQKREFFLMSLFSIFEAIIKLSKAYSKPCQLWALINHKDSSEDAIYIHTANPNQDNFPIAFSDFVDFDAEIPDWVKRHIKITKCSIGVSNHDGNLCYYVIYNGND